MGYEKIERQELEEGYKKIAEREERENPYKNSVLSGNELRQAIEEQKAKKNSGKFNRSYREINRKNPKPDEPQDPGRRRFLKYTGAVLAVAAAGKGLQEIADRLAPDEKNQVEKQALESEMENSVDEEEIKDYETTPEQTEIDEQNIESINEVFNFKSKERITFNRGTTIALKNYWKNKYRTDAKLKNSFDKAYTEMQKWRPYLEEIFTQNNVPLKYLFLAIPESHWQTGAVSRAQAVGPYQFMRRTAKSYGLTMNKFVDQRKDPLTSAEACAKLLRDNYKVTRDWDLAVAAYNWGETWNYKKQAKKKEEKASFYGYCQYAENQINDIKNELTNKKIRKTEARLKFLDKRKRAFIENLNYPSKFLAVEELIKEKEALAPPDKEIAKITFNYKKIEQPKNRFYKHIIKKVESVKQIARYHHITSGELFNANPELKKKSKNLQIGKIIDIPNKGAKLIYVKNLKADPNRIKYLNPALAKSVLDNHAPIPDNYSLRI